MQIALTKKLADAMDLKPIAVNEQMDSFFIWTANWTNTFDGRKEDMVVMGKRSNPLYRYMASSEISSKRLPQKWKRPSATRFFR